MALLNSTTLNEQALNQVALSTLSSSMNGSASVSGTIVNVVTISDLVATYKGVLNSVVLNSFALNKTTIDPSQPSLSGIGSLYATMVDLTTVGTTIAGGSSMTAPIVGIVPIAPNTMSGVSSVGNITISNTEPVSAGQSRYKGVLNSLVLNSLVLNQTQVTQSSYSGASLSASLVDITSISSLITGSVFVGGIYYKGELPIIRGGYNSFAYMSIPYSGATYDNVAINVINNVITSSSMTGIGNLAILFDQKPRNLGLILSQPITMSVTLHRYFK